MIPIIELAWTQLWQVTAVTVAVGLFTCLCCRHRPHLAHVLWLVVLLKCLTPPLFSSPTSVFSWAARESAARVESADIPRQFSLVDIEVNRPHSAIPHALSDGRHVPASAELRVARAAASDPPPTVSSNAGAGLARIPIRSALAISWLIGASAFAGHAMLTILLFWRTIRTSRTPVDERLASLALDLSSRLGIRRSVRLWVTAEPLGPLTFGWIRPTIVIPQALAAHHNNGELEPLLAHELVHVRRGDALVGLLQLAVRCLWWFHPLVWWASRRIDYERERCCDEEVVASLAFAPARYARSLLNVLELKRHLRSLPVSPGARPIEITQRRLEHLMLRCNRFRSRTPRRDWLALVVAALFLLPGAGLTGSTPSIGASSPQEPRSNRPEATKVDSGSARPEHFDPAETEMHVIGVYQPKSRPADEKGRVYVEVRPTAKPIVLVLTSYFSVEWRINLKDGARIKKVILSGYNEQEIKGLPAEVPIDNRSYFPVDGSRRQNGWFWAFEWNGSQWREMVRRLNAMTGLPVASFQGTENSDSFIVDGKVGREFGQNGLEPRAPVRKAPTPQELQTVSAGADLQVVGIYSPTTNHRGKPVDVEVRSTRNPAVLVLTSYHSAVWNVNCDRGARIKAVIVGGYSAQEVTGLSADVPVYYCCPDPSSYFLEGSRAAAEPPSFDAYKANTLDYRRMLETLNNLTGRLVTTFQGEYTADRFVVDGIRGREFAQKERQTRPAFPKPVKPEEFLAASRGSDVHVVSIYGTGPGNNGSPVDVNVRPTAKPIVLVLASYWSVLWNVKIAEGASVNAVVVAGYFEQELQGVPPGIPVSYKAYFPDRDEGYYWGFDWNSEECRGMVAKLQDMTGHPVSTFQGENTATSFVVDGTRGRNLAQQKQTGEQNTRAAAARKQPQGQEDPLADVADIPSQEVAAAGDSHKRYMLIGPKKNAKPPAEGFGLVVIMPGGDGSAAFHPFVKRMYKNALSDQFLAAQPVAFKWSPDQQIVWPTRANPVTRMKFSTEEFLESVIDDVATKHKVDRTRVFSLSWSSSGPAAYAASLQEKHVVTGSFIAMSVFKPELLPPLKYAKGHAYYLYHSPQDRICPVRMAEAARTSLTENGAKLHLETYEGGHGWRGDIFGDIRKGIEWLEENRANAAMP